MFIYWNARCLPKWDERKIAVNGGSRPDKPDFEDEIWDPTCGSQKRDTFKVLGRFGVCREDAWPWKDSKAFEKTTNKEVVLPTYLNTHPEDSAYKEAWNSTTIGYYRLDPDHPDSIEQTMSVQQRIEVGETILRRLKLCLRDGYPVVLGFWYFEERAYEKVSSDWQLKKIPRGFEHKRPPLDEEKNPVYGGHTVLCIGYTDNFLTYIGLGPGEEGAVLCQNS